MKIMYTPSSGNGPAYEIEADRHGSYAIWLNGKVVRRMTALTNYRGKPRWGSKKLEVDALEDAKCYLEWLTASGATRASAPGRGSAYCSSTPA